MQNKSSNLTAFERQFIPNEKIKTNPYTPDIEPNTQQPEFPDINKHKNKSSPLPFGVTTLKALDPGGLGEPTLVRSAGACTGEHWDELLAAAGPPFPPPLTPTEKSSGMGGIELTSILILARIDNATTGDRLSRVHLTVGAEARRVPARRKDVYANVAFLVPLAPPTGSHSPARGAGLRLRPPLSSFPPCPPRVAFSNLNFSIESCER